jgi:sporulation protein YlmC with PRC-barrel domain
MRASELVGAEVVTSTGRSLGHVTGLLCTLDGGGRGPVEAPRLRALVVGPRLLGRSLGYQQAAQRGPWLLRRVVRRLQRNARVVDWSEVRAVEDGTVRLASSSPERPLRTAGR